jgi:hypothetical protein
MSWLGRYAGMIAAALLAMAGWSAWMTNRGVQKERARVTEVGQAVSKKAQSLRKMAEEKPREALLKYCRDCSPGPGELAKSDK